MENLPILIVACMRDAPRLAILLRSLEKFSVESRQIHVVSGDLDFDTFQTDFYRSMIPTNRRHGYFLHPAHMITKTTSTIGWRHQQILKMCAYKLFDGDWLTMDCSNLVTRPWSNDDLWVDGQYVTIGCPLSRIGKHSFLDAISYYMAYFETVPPIIESCSSPFVLESSVVRQLISRFDGESRFVEWFANADFDPSEYILHSIFSQSLHGFNRHNHETKHCYYAWHPYQTSPDQLHAAFGDDTYKIITVHRQALKDHDIRMAYDECVSNLGLD